MSQIAAFVAILAYLAVILMFFALHRADRRNAVLTDAVSDYANGPAAGLFRLYGMAGIIGGLALALATASAPDHPFPVRVSLYLLGMALLRIGVLVFPTDPDGASLTRAGRLHLTFAIGSFALTYMALVVADAHLPPTVAAPLLAFLHLLGWIAAISLIAVVVCAQPPLRRVFGLAERSFLLSTALGFLILAIGLSGIGSSGIG